MTATAGAAGAANGVKRGGPAADDGRVDAADEELARQLAERARAEGLSLTGPDGLLGRLTKVVLESALEGEMDAHLGYRKHDPAGDGSGNSRNGHRGKTVLTGTGPVEVSVPRDRDASFEPVIVPKRARLLGGVDDMVISLVAKGLTTGEVQAHLAEIYGAQVSRETISNITDRVLDGMAEWQGRPLDAVYAVLFLDAIHVKIRDGQVANRPIYVALAVTADGERDILGLWAGEHGDGEGAKYWLRVLTEIRNRGTKDVLMVVCDGLKGFPEAISAVWRKRSPRPASCTCCATLSGMPASGTGPPSPATSSPSTPPHPRPRRWSGSPSSAAPGKPATRRSCGCGRTPGLSSCRSFPSTGRSGP